MSKVILITGASSGIGEATAKKLISEGHIVYGASRRIEKMDAIKKLGVHVLKMDVTKHDDVVKGVATVLKEQGRIDVLFNNAGFGLYGAVEDISLNDARYQFDVNIFGLADVTKQVVPAMRKQKSGTIINTSSVAGKIYMPSGAWYHATKHALEGWSDCLRLEVKPFGIDVVIIEPGLIGTEFSAVVSAPMQDIKKGSAYKATYKKMQATLSGKTRMVGTSDPSVIAEVVSKAINAKKPKTRYVKGAMAKPILFLRRILSDRAFDFLLNKMT